jgi:hypothetical protein
MRGKAIREIFINASCGPVGIEERYDKECGALSFRDCISRIRQKMLDCADGRPTGVLFIPMLSRVHQDHRSFGPVAITQLRDKERLARL